MKNEKSLVKIINFNMNDSEICASAARISTTTGDAIEIFEGSKSKNKNIKLIKKVLKSGHKSIIEHAVFTIAFCNVSAFVEQFFIECRLASFTVKSRRYVDFSKLGYYIPKDLEGEACSHYCQYMDKLFSAYQFLLEKGVPKEDARFLLPYSFNSNFYCTINARELAHCIGAIRYGRGIGITELQDIADQIERQMESIFPGLLMEIKYEVTNNKIEKQTKESFCIEDSVSIITPCEAGNVKILDQPSDALKTLETAYRINHPGVDTYDWKKILDSDRPRELEQLCYSFIISDITLSGITHIVRHRMQSIIIPSIQNINHSRFIIPETIKDDNELEDIYIHTLEWANKKLKQIIEFDILKRYSYYFALSGNTMDIMTTINARELNTIIKLRACNRAQWEIRKIAIEILKHLRGSCPELYKRFGTSCYVSGFCPEGNLTCGRKDYMIKHFMDLK